MGLTISSHKHSIDMGYGGYLRLRTTISELLGKEFALIYAELEEAYFYELWIPRGMTQDEYYEDYNKRVIELCTRQKLDEEVVNFLYRSDCSAKSVSPKTCRHLYKLIRDYDDDLIYGYCGRPDAARFKDFKQIVKECAEDRRVMRMS